LLDLCPSCALMLTSLCDNFGGLVTASLSRRFDALGASKLRCTAAGSEVSIRTLSLPPERQSTSWDWRSIWTSGIRGLMGRRLRVRPGKAGEVSGVPQIEFILACRNETVDEVPSTS
jgi:hypothetical protein